MLLWEGYAIVKNLLATFGKVSRIENPNPSTKEKKCLGISIEYDADFFLNHIRDGILPFWRKYSIDTKYGGFITQLDKKGGVYCDSAKTSAMQVRMIYGFPIGYEIQHDLDYLNIAKQGVKFLVENCLSMFRRGQSIK